MYTKKIFRRNKQVAKALVLFASILSLTLVLASFNIDSPKIRFMQWGVIICTIVFAILEFTVPFAKLTHKNIVVMESVFYEKIYHISNIIKIKNIRGRIVIIYTKDEKSHKIYLKGISPGDKNSFIRSLQHIAKHNHDEENKKHLTIFNYNPHS